MRFLLMCGMSLFMLKFAQNRVGNFAGKSVLVGRFENGSIGENVTKVQF